MQAIDAKPPYVQFETRPVEDRASSEANGHWIGRDEIFAIITPAGSKDRIERIAEDWFKQLREQVRQERFPGPWLDYYIKAFEAFKSNQELPEEGYPVREWPGINPSVRELLLSLNLRTVEQVSEMNEEAMSRIGIGARELKGRAIAFIQINENSAKVAKEVSSLRQSDLAKDAQIAELMDRLKKAEATINSLSKSKEEA